MCTIVKSWCFTHEDWLPKESYFGLACLNLKLHMKTGGKISLAFKKCCSFSGWIVQTGHFKMKFQIILQFVTTIWSLHNVHQIKRCQNPVCGCTHMATFVQRKWNPFPSLASAFNSIGSLLKNSKNSFAFALKFFKRRGVLFFAALVGFGSEYMGALFRNY